MKFIHSFWFKGIQESNLSEWGGFPDERYFWYLWGLSLARARRFATTVDLYTDSFGAEQMERLGFQYDSVHTVFDDLAVLPKEFWALPKLLVYAKQEEPFLHIDTDFVLLSFEGARARPALLVQSLESTPEQIAYYVALQKKMVEFLPELPKNYSDLTVGEEDLYALNCGIFGGEENSFIREYAQECVDIYLNPKNRGGWQQIFQDPSQRPDDFNAAIEQLNLAFHCRQRGLEPLLLHSREDDAAVLNNQMKPRYHHLIGRSKSDAMALHFFESLIKKQFPETEKRITDLVSSRGKAPIPTRDREIARAVHTFRFPKEAEESPLQFSGGFSSPRHFWYCWALAAHSVDLYFKESVLYTDSLGVRLAVEEFGFPYDEVKELPSQVETVPSEFWNVPKFCSYLSEEQPDHS